MKTWKNPKRGDRAARQKSVESARGMLAAGLVFAVLGATNASAQDTGFEMHAGLWAKCQHGAVQSWDYGPAYVNTTGSWSVTGLNSEEPTNATAQAHASCTVDWALGTVKAGAWAKNGLMLGDNPFDLYDTAEANAWIEVKDLLTVTSPPSDIVEDPVFIRINGRVYGNIHADELENTLPGSAGGAHARAYWKVKLERKTYMPDPCGVGIEDDTIEVKEEVPQFNTSAVPGGNISGIIHLPDNPPVIELRPDPGVQPFTLEVPIQSVGTTEVEVLAHIGTPTFALSTANKQKAKASADIAIEFLSIEVPEGFSWTSQAGDFLSSVSSTPYAEEVRALLGDLITITAEMDLPQGTARRLIKNLKAAQRRIGDNNPNNDDAAIGRLVAFMNLVEAQRGKKISTGDADILIILIQEIIGDYGVDSIDLGDDRDEDEDDDDDEDNRDDDAEDEDD